MSTDETAFEVQETYVNATADRMIGETPFEPVDMTRGEIFRYARGEYGRCVGKVYIDPAGGGPPRAIGWVFQANDRYQDTREVYLREVWVTVREITPEGT